MSTTRRKRILMLGPLPRGNEPIGGTQVSFEHLTHELERDGTLEIEVLDTSRDVQRAVGIRRACDSVGLFARTLHTVRSRLPDCDVLVFNASSGAMLRAGPFFAALARLHGKPFVARCFGGNLDLALESASGMQALLARRMLANADLVLLQTRALCEHFSRSARVRRLPTMRTPNRAALRREHAARKFLFLGQMRPEKGFVEALKAIESLPADCTLTLVGPRMPGTDLTRLQNHPRAKWLGQLAPDKISEILAAHDALVFPSYYQGEGLPGAVIEALQAGLPVIAADWRSMRELIVHERNGLLVAPRDVAALSSAMQRLAGDAQLVRRLSGDALRSGEPFQTRAVLASLISSLDALAHGAVLELREPVQEAAQ